MLDTPLGLKRSRHQRDIFELLDGELQREIGVPLAEMELGQKRRHGYGGHLLPRRAPRPPPLSITLLSGGDFVAASMIRRREASEAIWDGVSGRSQLSCDNVDMGSNNFVRRRGGSSMPSVRSPASPSSLRVRVRVRVQVQVAVYLDETMLITVCLSRDVGNFSDVV